MVNYKQFFIAAKKGYSILDSLIFKNLIQGHVKEIHRSDKLSKHEIIAFDKDQDWMELIGRHKEIHELL